jgi:Flp pilus assembly protein CpaB
MISSGVVAIELIPTKSYSPLDLSSLTGLSDEVLTQPVTKGHAIDATELKASTSSISVPTGLDAVTVTISGANSLAGYLQPGAHVDVYANITKASVGSGASSTLPVPCTELAMSDIDVLDVQSTVPSYASHQTSAGRTIPATETLLLAVSPSNARNIEFLSQNESISVVQTQQDANPPPLQQCIGTDQTTAAP